MQWKKAKSWEPDIHQLISD